MPANCIDVLESGILFKNDLPHVKSIHAYFPSIAVLNDGTLIASYILGEAFEAVNLQINLARSEDEGRTWQQLGPVDTQVENKVTSTFGRITATKEDELVANVVRSDRTDHPNCGLCNPDTMGFVPSELLLMRSKDQGTTWSTPEPVTPSITGPEFELCCPVNILNDGRWIWACSTWRDWSGYNPSGNRMIAFVSHDEGVSWPEHFDVMNSDRNNLIFWESKIVEYPTGRLLAVAWCYDEEAKADLPNQYSFSDDGGTTWSPVASTGLTGQTLTPFLLDDGTILNIYRRMDEPGLWACLSKLENNQWVNLHQQPLWGHNSNAGKTATNENMSENFAELKFGAPNIVRLKSGELFLTFWCYEKGVGVIRWFRLRK